ncbi:MAG: hypothetical protein QOF68_429 [Gaiellales bacterium]|nr:hypothetical protein [Gaiellales bacterium]
MFVRVVRFTDVDSGRVTEMMSRIDESDGPPPGVAATGFQAIVDAEQGTAVVLQFFETAEDMKAAEAVFDSMDAAETPGTRASIDRGEMKLDMKAPTG